MKKIKKCGILFLCFLMLFLLAACQKRTDVQHGEDVIYCLNKEQTGLIPITFDGLEGEVEKQVGAVLEELAKPSEDIEYTQVFPKELKINKYEVTNVIVYVDFNSAYLELSSLQEKLVRAALVKSLLQISGVQGVWISVNDTPLQNSDGTEVGLLNDDDFVENTGSSVSSYQTATLTLYFSNKEGDKLTQQKTSVRYSSNVPLEKIIVEKLMKGPRESGCYPTLNPAATLLSVTIKDGVCYVNFDSEFLNSVYDVKPEVAIYSLVNSLLEGTSAGKVQITINGVTDVSYKDTVDLSQPLQQNLELVETTEES